MGNATDLVALAGQLDEVFQRTLDRLETQIRDALLIDRELRLLLEQNESDESIINWDPERAISPKYAFRSLALRLIKEADTAVTRESAISPLDYEDLLNWVDEPRRRSGMPTQDVLLRVEYARQKRLATFWTQFQARIAPDREPMVAHITAIEDLLSSFAVSMPTEYVIPFSRISAETLIIPFALQRRDEDLEWVVREDVMGKIAKANHAIATICQLQHESVFASLILEMNATFHNKMRTGFQQYTPDDHFLAGGVLSMRMKRDHIDYRMSPQLFDLLKATMSKVRGLYFVHAPKFA